MKQFLVGICFLVICFVSLAQPTPAERIKQRIQAKLDSFQKANGFPGVTYSVILPGGEKISVASGLADSVLNIPMQPNYRMLAGSIGKTFFAAVVMSLMEKKNFDLDDKIENYIGSEPWFKRIPNADSITIRMLMNHSSGIEEYYELGDFMEKLENDPYKIWTPLETFSYIFDRKPLFSAGQGFSYADANYLILGYIIEKITGKKMYDLAAEYSLKPFALSQTEPSIKISYKQFATGYSNDRSPFPFHGAMVKDGKFVFQPQFEWTGGGFVSSSSDLATWAKEYYKLKFISEGSRKQMQNGIAANTGRNHLYGLGMQIRPAGEYGFGYGHSGWFPGYISDMQYYPQLDLSMAIQFNTDDFRKLKRPSDFYFLQLIPVILEELKK